MKVQRALCTNLFLVYPASFPRPFFQLMLTNIKDQSIAVPR